MGPLTLPAGGTIYIDANAIIYSVERVEPYRRLLAPMWQQARGGPIHAGKQRASRAGSPDQTPARRKCSP